MRDPSTLQVVWFGLISILWLGYFVLEGFDFGVGTLLRYVARTDSEKKATIHTIGPVWDGNEVWLLVAGGATFAAFPQWYATLFSGFYLALFLILVALIVRNVSFEFWGKNDDPAWRSRWEWAMTICSAAAALLWGVGWANIIHGVPIDHTGEFTGTIFTLLGPYALLGGVTTLLLFTAHGAIFLTLRTTGVIAERARAAARVTGPAAAVALTAFLAWTLGHQGGVELVSAICAVGAVALAAGSIALGARRAGWAFAASAGAILLLFCALFADLYPNAMVSSTSSAFDLTLRQASSSNYTLTVMTVVAALLVPVVLVYQAWTYWVFRARLRGEDFETIHSPLDALDRGTRGAESHGAGSP